MTPSTIAAHIKTKLKDAIKEFGTHAYYDRGASEIIDVKNIADELFYEEGSTEDIVKILKSVAKLKHGKVLVSELVIMLMQDYSSDFADELAEVGGDFIPDYY
jgi:hypothetical protein